MSPSEFHQGSVSVSMCVSECASLNSHLSVKSTKLQVSVKCARGEHTAARLLYPGGMTLVYNNKLLVGAFTPTG